MVALAQAYEMVPVGRLHQHPANPRRGDVAAIGDSIAANGFYGAVVAQRSTGYVLAGNHRVQAAQKAGMDAVPVVWVDVDDERARRILLADNRTTDLAINDQGALLALLEELAATPDALAGTAFNVDDMDGLLAAMGSTDAPYSAPADTDAHYAETPEEEQARLATKGAEPSIHTAGLRELVLVYPSDEHAAVVDLVNLLRPALGADATTAQVVAAALRLAAGRPDELCAQVALAGAA